MGGRGRSNKHQHWVEDQQIERNYEIITRKSLQGSATYAFLERLKREYAIITSAVDNPAIYDLRDTFGMARPTLRWVNGDQIVDLFVDGMTTQEFLAASGLELSLDKGGFVLSKRLSRILRPQYATAFFNAEDVNIHYMDLDTDGAKIWDGAGLVSRDMLLCMVDQLPDVSEHERAQIMRELKHAHRVEFTIMTANGQDKGHCIVSDMLDVDFLLPQDTKREVKLTDGTTFVGFNFVHGHTDMRLDVQSLINLHPFFDENQLTQWLHDEGDLFMSAIQSGDVGAAMARIDRFTTVEEVQSWPLREYLASGGHPMWFASHVKSFANQHLERLNYSTLGKMRLPIPGGRMYVMPAGVGQTAGLNARVERGQIFVDPSTATAWVNDADWLQLGGSDMGIAGILGGADNDDALWLHNFTDYDGQRKVLAWRSPNQGGEYVILHPTEQSDALTWQSPRGEIRYPANDSRKLMPRIDTVQPDYLNLVNPATAGGLGEGQNYAIEVMEAVIERAKANQGALGAYCNNLMLSKALYDSLPAKPPAPLEDVIDGSVKLGTDLSPVLDWTRAASIKILEQRKPIPQVLQHRLGPTPPGTPAPVSSHDHWLDRLVSNVQAHIHTMETRRDALVQQTMPPRAIFDAVVSQPMSVEIGAKLNQTYTSAIKQIAKTKIALTADDYAIARQAAEHYLHQFPVEEQADILRGAIVSAYIRDEVASDAALWLAGEKLPTGRAHSIGQQTIAALRGLGLLDELTGSERGVLAYPGATTSEAPYRTIGINGVWRPYYERWSNHHGHEATNTKSVKGKRGIRWAKAQVKQRFQSGETIALDVREIEFNGEARKALFDADGQRFGLLARDSEQAVHDRVHIRFALAHDGNLRAVIDDEA